MTPRNAKLQEDMINSVVDAKKDDSKWSAFAQNAVIYWKYQKTVVYTKNIKDYDD